MARRRNPRHFEVVLPWLSQSEAVALAASARDFRHTLHKLYPLEVVLPLLDSAWQAGWRNISALAKITYTKWPQVTKLGTQLAPSLALAAPTLTSLRDSVLSHAISQLPACFPRVRWLDLIRNTPQRRALVALTWPSVIWLTVDDHSAATNEEVDHNMVTSFADRFPQLVHLRFGSMSGNEQQTYLSLPLPTSLSSLSANMRWLRWCWDASVLHALASQLVVLDLTGCLEVLRGVLSVAWPVLRRLRLIELNTFDVLGITSGDDEDAAMDSAGEEEVNMEESKNADDDACWETVEKRCKLGSVDHHHHRRHIPALVAPQLTQLQATVTTTGWLACGGIAHPATIDSLKLESTDAEPPWLWEPHERRESWDLGAFVSLHALWLPSSRPLQTLPQPDTLRKLRVQVMRAEWGNFVRALAACSQLETLVLIQGEKMIDQGHADYQVDCDVAEDDEESGADADDAAHECTSAMSDEEDDDKKTADKEAGTVLGQSTTTKSTTRSDTLRCLDMVALASHAPPSLTRVHFVGACASLQFLDHFAALQHFTGCVYVQAPPANVATPDVPYEYTPHWPGLVLATDVAHQYLVSLCSLHKDGAVCHPRELQWIACHQRRQVSSMGHLSDL